MKAIKRVPELSDIFAVGKKIEDILIDNACNSPESIYEMEQMYDIILILMQKKRYRAIDLLLDIIPAEYLDIDVLLSLLTTTSWCKDKLKNRAEFFRRASLRYDCVSDKRMLEGLE